MQRRGYTQANEGQKRFIENLPDFGICDNA